MNYRGSVEKNSPAMKPMRRFAFLNTAALATVLDLPASSASTDIRKAASICSRNQE
jgi:hypothetical protein